MHGLHSFTNGFALKGPVIFCDYDGCLLSAHNSGSVCKFWVGPVIFNDPIIKGIVAECAAAEAVEFGFGIYHHTHGHIQPYRSDLYSCFAVVFSSWFQIHDYMIPPYRDLTVNKGYHKVERIAKTK